jgi:hypothetical protein
LWKRPTKEFNNVGDTLRMGTRISGGPAKSHQESDMPSNAVANPAKARQVDEKALLENGRKRVIEVGGLCESPQFFSNLGSLGCKAEEIGKNPEPLFYAISKV